jgi:hypothetical protein
LSQVEPRCTIAFLADDHRRRDPAAEAVCRRIDLARRNEDELAAICRTLGAALPGTLRRFAIDRRGHWDASAHDDVVELVDGRLDVEIGELGPPRPVVEVIAAFLRAYPEISALSVGVWRGRVELDDLFAVLRALGAPALRELAFYFQSSGRDWMEWIAALPLDAIAAACPGLEQLSLPIAELTAAGALRFLALRSLELNWLGCTPVGPSNPNDVQQTARGAGLTPLREAELPRLERLAIDFQFEWYVRWTDEDLAALAAAHLPALRTLVLRYCLHGDALISHLLAAPYLAQLDTLELTGTEITEVSAARLLDARRRFTKLRALIWLQPLDLDDATWRKLAASYPIAEP